MLSRFSLPSVFSTKTNYTTEEVDKAVSRVKALGRRTSQNSGEHGMSDIQEILDIMKKYTHSLAIQRVTCHALSNIAMQVVAARWIVQKHGFELILKAVDNFLEDHKLCWLASSAVWNLARPPANRSSIGSAGAKAMLRILKQHRKREKVTNTAIGALSNLSLLDNLKDMIATTENMDLVLAVLSHAMLAERSSVMTSGAGLLANIAVSDDYAAKLIKHNALEIVLPLLKWEQEEDTLFRNTCAALNNLVTAQGFLESFLRSKGLEIVLKFLEKHNDESFSGLLENCLATIDAEKDVETTSLHYSCYHGKLAEFDYLYNQQRDFNLNEADQRNMTCLDYAISSNHANLVKHLCKIGATQHSQENIEQEIQIAICEGQKTLKDAIITNEKVIEDTLTHFPTDICKFVVSFQHKVDLLDGMNLLD